MTNADTLYLRPKERLEQIQTENFERLQSLAREGMQLDPNIMAIITMDELITELFKNKPEAVKLNFLIRTQERFAEVLADAAQQLTRAKLTQGVSNSGLVIAGQ